MSPSPFLREQALGVDAVAGIHAVADAPGERPPTAGTQQTGDVVVAEGDQLSERVLKDPLLHGVGQVV